MFFSIKYDISPKSDMDLTKCWIKKSIYFLFHLKEVD